MENGVRNDLLEVGQAEVAAGDETKIFRKRLYNARAVDLSLVPLMQVSLLCNARAGRWRDLTRMCERTSPLGPFAARQPTDGRGNGTEKG